MKNTKDTAQPKLFIGMDIHKRSWRIQIATDLFQGKGITLPSAPEALQAYVNKNFPDYEVYTAYEAGCLRRTNTGHEPKRRWEGAQPWDQPSWQSYHSQLHGGIHLASHPFRPGHGTTLPQT